MGILSRMITLAACALVCGCAAQRGFISGRGAEYRAEYERHKAAVLAAPEANAEAKALHELGVWFNQCPYGYTLSTASQPNTNGVNSSKLRPGEPVELRLHAKSDYEPRRGGFTFVPKEPANLLLLAGDTAAGR
jgi:hypothetical protein